MSKNCLSLSSSINLSHAKIAALFCGVIFLADTRSLLQAVGAGDHDPAPAVILSEAEQIAYLSSSPLLHSQARPAPAGLALFDRRYPGERATIAAAAARNGCQGEDYVILLAIRCAENGRTGLAFGVLHPAAANTDLDTQAGWCAATIVKTRQRWSAKEVDATLGGNLPGTADASGGVLGEERFIDFLAARYCPAECDPVGHANWKRNVMYWYGRFNHEGHEG